MKNVVQKKCIVVTCFDQNQPGFLDFSYRIQSLAKQYQLTVLSQSEITQAELLFDQIAYKTFPSGRGKLGWISYLVKCAQFIGSGQSDVVVLLHSATAPIALLIRSIPVCLYWNEHPTNLIHLPTKFAPIRRLITSALHRLIFFSASKASLLMPIGEEHQYELCKHQIDPNKIKMIYMGVSDNFLLKDCVKKVELNEAVQLVYVGTVSKVRGRDVMLDAMAILIKENIHVHLTIIGASEDELVYCKQRIHELEIKEFITLIGRISGSQIPNFLIKADVGICLWEPSPWNEFNPPTKLFEYLVAGIPVLASNIRTHSRYIKDWHNGLIFDYDETSLANAITELCRHNNRIQTLKDNAAQSAERYLWSGIEPIFLGSVASIERTQQINYSVAGI